MSDFFWLFDMQWERIEPLLPTDVRGKPGVDHRRVLSGLVHALRRRRKKGGLAHGIGRTKGGRNTKLHVVCDTKGRPHVLRLTPGNVHDCKMARHCIGALPPSAELVADKG